MIENDDTIDTSEPRPTREIPPDELPSNNDKEFDMASQLNDAQEAIKVLKLTMDEKSSALQKERAIFEENRKILDKVHFSKHVKLNVGGQVFKTSIGTLLKDSDSMLAAMFSKRFDVQPDEVDGAYFIDRDGTHFRYILNYLRIGKLNSNLKENKALASDLYAEAEFYQISGLQKEIWPGPCFEDSSHIIHSLSSEQMNALLSWLPPGPALHNWIQCYSGVMDGWSASSFHKNCDEKGPTIVIARVGNIIFGGYAHASWDICSSFVQDDSSFLFVLSLSSGSSPTKLAQNNGGIWCSSSYGPVFGSSDFKTALLIQDGCSSACEISDRSSSSGFKIPGTSSLQTFLGAGGSFSLQYLEVFSLEKCF